MTTAERSLAALPWIAPSAQSGELEREAADALARSAEALLDMQDPAGWWKGDLETNVAIEAEDLLLRTFLGICDDEILEPTANWIRSRQCADGGWSNRYGGPSELSLAVEAYVALRLAGDSPDAEHMRLAAEFVRDMGGLECSRVFTRIWLALFGQWSWRDLPAIPPELILLPRWLPLNIYDFACWARQTIVPLSVVSTYRPQVELGFTLDELRTGAVSPRAGPPVDPHARRLLPAPRQGVAQVPRPGAVAAAGDLHEARRAVDHPPPGVRRLLGRHPAALGVLDHRPAPAGVLAGSSHPGQGAGVLRQLRGAPG